MSRSDLLARFEQCGILPTPQRIAVADVLLHKPQHLSAEQVLSLLKEGGSAVSKATVYNSLNLFAERGLIKEVLVDPERRIYDSTTRNHHHFYNADTGELSDIASDTLQVDGLPPLPPGTELESAEVVIRIRNSTT